jgi:hypothetical protein
VSISCLTFGQITPGKSNLKKLRESLFKNWFGRTQSAPQESIYFYSLHKAGTSIITHALRQVTNLKHVDYETTIFNNKLHEKPVFYDHGHLYGVFRITQPNEAVMYTTLTQYIATEEFVRNKTLVLMVRDPRDILISLYYSVRDSHAISANPQLKERALRQRNLLQSMSLEEFVLEKAPRIPIRFETLHRLSQSCRQKVILKYEDLINNFEGFMTGFEQYIKIPQERKEELYRASRPRLEEDPAAHKRSGKIAQYKEKLTPATQQKLTEICRPALELFGYDANDIPIKDV